jgi:hypothetical protein
MNLNEARVLFRALANASRNINAIDPETHQPTFALVHLFVPPVPCNSVDKLCYLGVSINHQRNNREIWKYFGALNIHDSFFSYITLLAY